MLAAIPLSRPLSNLRGSTPYIWCSLPLRLDEHPLPDCGLQLLGHVRSVQFCNGLSAARKPCHSAPRTVAKFSVVVPCAYSTDDGNLGRAMFFTGNPLRFFHEQRAKSLPRD